MLASQVHLSQHAAPHITYPKAVRRSTRRGPPSPGWQVCPTNENRYFEFVDGQVHLVPGSAIL